MHSVGTGFNVHAKLHTFCITYVKVCTYIIRICTCNLPSKLGMQCICYNHIVIRHAISSTYYLLGYYGDLIHLSHSHFHCRSGLTVSQQGRRPLPFCPCPLARPHTELLWQFYLFWVRIQNLAAAVWKDGWKLICVCCSRNLCNMTLNISTAQSKSLLQIHQKDKNSSASPPTMAAALLCSNPSSHLVHPGAVLCMLDLLPAISLDSSQLPGDQDDDDDQCWVVAHDKLSKDEGRMVPERDSEIGAGRGSELLHMNNW